MSPTPIRTPSRRARQAFVVGAVLSLALAGCAKGESQPAAPAGSGPAATVAAEQAGGPTCTLSQTGYPKADLTSAIVGFSQSEKEGNPFRIGQQRDHRPHEGLQGRAGGHTGPVGRGRADRRVRPCQGAGGHGAAHPEQP